MIVFSYMQYLLHTIHLYKLIFIYKYKLVYEEE
jgi:hypothetical protein